MPAGFAKIWDFHIVRPTQFVMANLRVTLELPDELVLEKGFQRVLGFSINSPKAVGV